MEVYQDVDLTFDECVVPPIIHVKQYDNLARKIRCRLYLNGTDYDIPGNTLLSYSGKRPDGKVFQYGSDLAPEKIYIDGDIVVFLVTEFMTERFGSVPIDLTLFNQEGETLGVFCLILKVEQGAIPDGNIGALSYEQALGAVGAGIYECFVTDDGNFVIVSDDGLGLTEGSESSTVDMIVQVIVNASVTDDGYLAYETDDALGLVFSMDKDGEGYLIVTFGDD